MRLFVHVEDLQGIDVLDQAVAGLAVERIAVADDVQAQRHARGERPDEQRHDTQQDRGIDDDARPDDARWLALHGVFRGVLDETLLVAHLVHHVVTGVDAGGTGDALVLQAVADIDAGRADLHAQGAVDAVAQAQLLRVGAALARTARLAALRDVGDDQRVLVEHRALEARVGAHVQAYLLAHPAGVAVGGKAVEIDPEIFPGAEIECQHTLAQVGDRCEIAHEGEAGPQREHDPQQMLGGLDAELAGIHRLRIELFLLHAVALDLALDPQEHLGPYRLRTGVAAPDAPEQRGHEEQGESGDDQQGCQVDEVLRPQRDEEDVELARRQVEQQGLVTVPAQPRHDVVETQQPEYAQHAQAGEQAVHLARVDLLRLGIEGFSGLLVGTTGRGWRFTGGRRHV